jgi:ABC-type multidrug transport system ATPase subunit/pSer/pThr/pTyr-binding forkhead associated (FHA) protein
MDIINEPQALASITFLAGPLVGKTYPITKPVITLGRDPSNDIVISEPSVSRYHARISFHHGAWMISKLQQQNRLMINQHDMQEGPLQHRDTVGLGTGTTAFVFQVAAVPAAEVIAPSSMRPGRADAPPKTTDAPNNDLPLVLKPPVQDGSISYSPSNATSDAQQAPVESPHVPLQNFSPAANVQASPIQPGPGPGGPMRQDVGRTDTERGSYTVPSSIPPRGVPALEVSNNTNRDRYTYELNKPVTNIGRAPGNDIVINMPTVSAFHAQIVRDGNQLVFIHPHPDRVQTLNGIIYNGRSIAGNERFRSVLKRGDILRISDEHGTYVTLTYHDGSGVQEIVPEIRPVPLNAPVITLGRAPDNMVVLNHPQVSAHHARLERVQNGYRIIDLNSTNHVYINARRVTSQVLTPGDEIRIGPYKLTYTGTQLTQYDESQHIRIDALHLKKEGNRHVILINDISLVIPPRKFVAIVGGSGAGKSMLMDALNGLRPAQQGKVLYNGQDYYSHLAAFSTQIGYVPQDDIIHRDLTVERALYYAAKLRLPDDFTEAQIRQRIEEVLDDVEMKGRRNLLVSRLSGGQRKRVSIALELLANPSVFFLDEPTSGLDPGLDRKMMLLLRKLADKGHTIVLVTHATNNINNCDYICFLCQGGRLAYYGPPDGAKAYFGKTDFAEIYSALEPTDENKNVPAEAEARFKQSEDYRRYVLEPLSQGPAGRMNYNEPASAVKPPKRGNAWKQFRILTMRYLTLLFNDRINLAILILQAPILALFLFVLTPSAAFQPTSIATCPTRANPTATSGPIVSFDCQRVVDLLNTPQGQQFAAQQGKSPDQVLNDAIIQGAGFDAQKTLLFMAFAVVLLGCINGVREIVKEEPIYRRERAVNLGIVPYMFSKIVVQGVLILLQCLIVVLIVNARAPFQHSTLLPPLLEVYITLALTAIAALMLGLAVSAISPNTDRAMSIVPLLLVPQILFSGAIFALNNLFFQFLGLFFAVHWGMAGMGSTVGLHADKLVQGDNFIYQGTLFTSVDPTKSVPGAVFHLFLVWFALIVMSLVLGLATAYFLKKKDVLARG